VLVYEGMLRRAAAPTSYVTWVAKLDRGAPVTDLIAAAFDGGEYAHRIAG